MRPLPFLLAALLSWGGPALADAKKADDRVRTVILGLVPRHGVDDTKLAAALNDVLQGVYSSDPGRLVIGRDDIKRVMELEADKQSMGCDSDKCMAEVGQALDAARLVTGSIDKLGDGYMITMSEIDAKTLEAVARVQDRVKADENALVDGVSRLAADLLKKGSSNTVSHSVVGNAGSVEIETDPRAAKITFGGNEMGVSPTKIDNLATGTQKLRLIRDDYEPIEVDVPIFAGGTTKVHAEMRILRKIAESNLGARQAAWREKNQWNTAIGWTKVGIGGVVGVGGVLYGVGNGVDKAFGGQGANGAAIGGLIVGGIGAAVLAWGVIDLITPPVPPVPEWEIERKVVVTPPKGNGNQRIQVIQEKLGAASTR